MLFFVNFDKRGEIVANSIKGVGFHLTDSAKPALSNEIFSYLKSSPCHPVEFEDYAEMNSKIKYIERV